MAVNFIWTAAAVLALIALPVAGEAQNMVVEIDLSKMEPGRPPQDFDISRTGHGAPATWVVVADIAATSGRASRRPVLTAQTIAFRSQSPADLPRTSRSQFASNRWPARSTRQAGSPCG
jgi:hypothetical protein